MSRLGRILGLALTATIAIGGGAGVLAQDATTPDVATRAQMAAMTLDSTALPGGYIFTGESFVGADQAATGYVTADALTDAGFQSQYLSVYTNPDTGYRITSYVSAWTDADAAKAGFEVIEDESKTIPGGTLEDGDAGVGETPGETTTGTYPDAAGGDATIAVADVTFRIDRFLVGTSLETRDGTTPDAATIQALAGSLEGRATSVIGNDSPDGTDLALAPQVLPLFGLGQELQSGFLASGEVEQMYGLQGSALGTLTASWNEAIALGEGDAPQPYVAVGVTTFGSEDAAAAIVDQLADLGPDVPGAEAIEGVEIEGADAVAASSFPSQATGAGEADSVRVVTVSGSTLVVIDVQGAPSVEVAQAAAETFAGAQLSCLGQDTCTAPEIPADLIGA